MTAERLRTTDRLSGLLRGRQHLRDHSPRGDEVHGRDAAVPLTTHNGNRATSCRLGCDVRA